MIGFRVDANEKIATGHLMRCISIATELLESGIPCIFFLAEEKETARLKAAGIPYEILHSDWNHPESELPQLLPLLKHYPLKWLIVDSYQVTNTYLSKLDHELPVLYIDDIEQEIYPVTAILHYGLRPDPEAYLHRYAHTATKILEGTKYTPLRREFQSFSEPVSRQKSILLTTGGTDPFHISLQLLSACLNENPSNPLIRSLLTDFSFDVIIGSLNRDDIPLQTLASHYPQIRLHKNVNNMNYYMRRSTLAISAGGTTLSELCACSTPTICFSFADNQMEGTLEMGRRKIMLYAGDARQDPVIDNILHSIYLFLSDKSLYEEYAGRMNTYVDGLGVKRIADFLLQ